MARKKQILGTKKEDKGQPHIISLVGDISTAVPVQKST